MDIVLRSRWPSYWHGAFRCSIRTLVIDEGFDAQDSEGIDRLASAVHRLRQEWRRQRQLDLVIVVTHVEELKNRFERLMVVEKTAAVILHC